MAQGGTGEVCGVCAGQGWVPVSPGVSERCVVCNAAIAATDLVHHPDHYCRGGMEARDVIAAMMPPGLTGYQGWCWGNAMKYLLRLGCKGPALEDLAKAGVYLDWLGASLEE